MKNIVDEVRQELLQNSDETVRESGKRFFKEPVRTYGVKTSLVTRIAKQTFARLKQRSKEEVFVLCEGLWRSGFLEEAGIACHWSYAMRAHYIQDDLATFEHWLDDYVSNWAACDVLCNHTIGAFMEIYPQCIADVKKWTGSDNRWKRRAAAVSLIIPARKGMFLQDIIAIAETMLTDKDDMVQKEYGWMLKVAGQAHPEEIYVYLLSRKDSMPRTAFRYALEKMPKEWRAEAMKK